MNQRKFWWLSWILVDLAILVPLLAWLQLRNFDLSTITMYSLFPLLGLWAWLVMWGHYVTGAFRVLNPTLKKPSGYSTFTGWLVLTLILLHPGLLALKQYQVGLGLPFSSFPSYAGETMLVALMFGSIALTIFLSFEIFDRVKTKPWVKNNWRWVSLSQVFAMILIFIHALRLGSNLQATWLGAVWIACGVILIPCFYIILKADFSTQQLPKS